MFEIPPVMGMHDRDAEHVAGAPVAVPQHGVAVPAPQQVVDHAPDDLEAEPLWHDGDDHAQPEADVDPAALLAADSDTEEDIKADWGPQPPEPCCICLEPYEPPARRACTLPCGHHTCKPCLLSMYYDLVAGKNTCPVCREPFNQVMA